MNDRLRAIQRPANPLDGDGDVPLPNANYPPRRTTAAPVEQFHDLAGSQAQDAGGVVGLPRRQLHNRPLGRFGAARQVNLLQLRAEEPVRPAAGIVLPAHGRP
jgi:hypothetical protein